MFLPLKDDTPRLGAPWLTLFLVAASVVVFLYQLSLPREDALRFIRAAGLIPWELRHLHDLVGDGHPPALAPPPLTVLTSLFVHGDPLHLAGNMWFLWVFGSRLEGYVGRWRFLGFYLIAGSAAAALQVAAEPGSMLPMIGASGAIAGVLGGYALGFPRARVRCLTLLLFFVTFIELPASVLLGAWFLVQFIAAGGVRGGEAGVAWYAHIGGFLAGLALGRLFLPASRRRRARTRIGYDVSWWQNRTPSGSASW